MWGSCFNLSSSRLLLVYFYYFHLNVGTVYVDVNDLKGVASTTLISCKMFR